MLVEPRPPYRAHAVAGLQQRPHPRTGPAAHQAKMPAVLAGQQFGNGGGFAMPPHAQHDAFVGPFHGGNYSGISPDAEVLAAEKPTMATLIGDLIAGILELLLWLVWEVIPGLCYLTSIVQVSAVTLGKAAVEFPKPSAKSYPSRRISPDGRTILSPAL